MIAIHICEAARKKAYAVAQAPQFAEVLRKRRKVEALFSELKNLVGLPASDEATAQSGGAQIEWYK